MKEHYVSRLLLAAPQNLCAKIKDLLAAAQIVPDEICHTGAQVLETLQGQAAVLLTTWRLDDMMGLDLADQAGEMASVLMIVPQDFEMEQKKHTNVLLLRNPLSPEALTSSVRTMCFCSERMQALQKKADKLARTLEERKVIERAKGKLMDTLHLSESEAHYRIQKKSMDTGKRIVDIAREILESEEILAG